MKATLKDRKGFTKTIDIPESMTGMYDGFPPRQYAIAVMPSPEELWRHNDTVVTKPLYPKHRTFKLVNWLRDSNGVYVEAFYEEV